MSNDKIVMLKQLFPVETKRLVIKPTVVEDVDLLLKMDKQEETQKFLGGIKDNTREEWLGFLEKRISSTERCSFTVFLKDNVPIGLCELKMIDNYAELSYIFDYDHCNNGYCTEACRKIIEFAFKELNLKYIYASVIKDNHSSVRVLEKLGFKYQDSIVKDSVLFLKYILTKKK